MTKFLFWMNIWVGILNFFAALINLDSWICILNFIATGVMFSLAVNQWNEWKRSEQ
jgi:uncharacterized protein involved in response to NO